MEVFKAVCNFTPPADSGQGLLSFSKGDQFEVFDKTKADWWGARRLNDNSAGFVPSKYLQFEERRIGKLLPDNYRDQRDTQLKKVAAMQNSNRHKNSGGSDSVPDIPTPDYDPDTPVAERNSFVFLEKFKGVISNINSIEELYSQVPEPVPDYQDEDSNDFPPPPPPIAADEEPASPTDTTTAHPTVIGVRNGAVSSPEDEGEIIQPKKLFNPCAASRERQALHKELLMNYKLGKDVLQKPELNKILAKRKESQKKKEWEELQANKRTSLELKLEEQANKLKEKEDGGKMKPIKEDEQAPEFVQMHRRITHKTPTSPPT